MRRQTTRPSNRVSNISWALHLKQLVKYVGILIVLLCFYYIADKIKYSWPILAYWRPSTSLAGAILASIFVYAMCGFILSSAWCNLLAWSGQANVDRRIAHNIYAKTQLAKYLPGNIFHYAGRHLLGRKAGFGHMPLVASSLYEIIGVVTAASLLAVGGMLLYRQSVGGYSIIHGLILLGTGIAAGITIAIAAPHLARLKGLDMPAKGNLQTLAGLVPVIGLYLIFFAIIGGLLAWLTYIASPYHAAGDVGRIITVYAVAWLAGYMVPGASAGIGVREAIITAALGPMLGEALSVTLALVFRLITISGDVVFFLSASAICLRGTRT